MRKDVSLIVGATILLVGCASDKPRWALPGGQIKFNPICSKYRAPALEAVPDDGLVPAFAFRVNGASIGDENALRTDLKANGFVVGEGTVTINKSEIIFAAGDGRLRTQPMADRLYDVMCELERKNIRLVHARYNVAAEAGRII